MKKYSETIKQQALEMVAEQGLRKASEVMNLPKTTLMRWRREASNAGAEQKETAVIALPEETADADTQVSDATMDVNDMESMQPIEKQAENHDDSIKEKNVVCGLQCMFEDDTLLLLRLQKAEIEGLRKENERLKNAITALIDRQK